MESLPPYDIPIVKVFMYMHYAMYVCYTLRYNLQFYSKNVTCRIYFKKIYYNVWCIKIQLLAKGKIILKIR